MQYGQNQLLTQNFNILQTHYMSLYGQLLTAHNISIIIRVAAVLVRVSPSSMFTHCHGCCLFRAVQRAKPNFKPLTSGIEFLISIIIMCVNLGWLQNKPSEYFICICVTWSPQILKKWKESWILKFSHFCKAKITGIMWNQDIQI